MASYTNLASLSGLQIGDVITYNTDMAIDFAKYKVKIIIYGKGEKRTASPTATGIGGTTQFNLSTNSSYKNFYFSLSGGTSLCYGSSYNAYYRIAVAGNAGGIGYRSNGSAYSCHGGGEQAQYGSTSSDSRAQGGSQIQGGQLSNTLPYQTGATAGSFGVGGGTPASYKYGSSTYLYGGYGGDGWYGGASGANGYKNSTYYSQAGGGGSGFVIGLYPTTYPSGYLGDNSNLISALTSLCSNATLTTGNNQTYHSAGFMTVEIIELPSKSFPKYYDGSTWKDTEWKYYDGSTWKDIELKYYDGSAWKDVG